jgi:riboflavin kinase/FMN adenylyltransferase
VAVVVAEWFTPAYKEILPETFVNEYLKKHLDARYVAAGFNYPFGKNGAGDRETLKELCNACEIEVRSIDAVSVDDAIVSSSRIRELIQEGNMQDAARCLGRQFSLTGTVTSGNQIGRTLGFPTANLACPNHVMIPKFGVYLARVQVNGVWHPAICNVGARPTVIDHTPWLEAHLLDFYGDLYEQEIEIAFCDYLREIRHFESLAALQNQLEQDKAAAREYFK